MGLGKDFWFLTAIFWFQTWSIPVLGWQKLSIAGFIVILIAIVFRLLTAWVKRAR